MTSSGVPVGDTTLLQRLTKAHKALLEANRCVTQKNLGRGDAWLNGVEDLLDTATLGLLDALDALPAVVTLIEAAQSVHATAVVRYGVESPEFYAAMDALSDALAPFVGEATQ